MLSLCLFICLFSLRWAKLSEVVILSADDWVCIILFVQMRCPAQGATGGWVMPGPVFKWFPLCELSLFDTPQGQFSGISGLGVSAPTPKVQGLISGQKQRFHNWFVMALSEGKTNVQKQETKDEPLKNGSYKIRQIIIKIMEYTHIHMHL